MPYVGIHHDQGCWLSIDQERHLGAPRQNSDRAVEADSDAICLNSLVIPPAGNDAVNERFFGFDNTAGMRVNQIISQQPVQRQSIFLNLRRKALFIKRLE